VALDAQNEEGEPKQAEPPDKSATPWENAHNSEMAGLVKQAINTLPYKLKAAILLSVYEELPHLEIANALHCSAKAVENRIRRAREILAKSLSAVR
jgi:RNA polymerase sigma-70 factor (ECF subfamily)